MAAIAQRFRKSYVNVYHSVLVTADLQLRPYSTSSLASSSLVSFVGQNLRLCSGVLLFALVSTISRNMGVISSLSCCRSHLRYLKPKVFRLGQRLTTHAGLGRVTEAPSCALVCVFIAFSLAFLASIEERNFFPNASGRTSPRINSSTSGIAFNAEIRYWS